MHLLSLFFLNDTPTTEIYTLSLHDALPIFKNLFGHKVEHPQKLAEIRDALEAVLAKSNTAAPAAAVPARRTRAAAVIARSEEQRLNSSHTVISYAVFCLKKKTKARERRRTG